MTGSKFLNMHKKRQTFNYMDFIMGFDFCNRHERKALYDVVKKAWEWAYPPMKKQVDIPQNADDKPNCNLLNAEGNVKYIYIQTGEIKYI